MFRKQTFRTILASLMLTLGGAGLGDIFKSQHSLWAIAAGIICFAIGAAIQLWTVSIYKRFQTKNLHKIPAGKRRALIIFLSKCYEMAPPLTLTGDLDADLRALAAEKRRQTLAGERVKLWNWEQPLRAIYHNYWKGGPLQRVILIGSPDSVVQFKVFKDTVFDTYEELTKEVTLEAFYGQTRRIQKITVAPAPDNGFDFEDFDVLTHALDDVIQKLKEDPRSPISPSKIQIDFTGGQKPTSVVAAVVTLFSRISNLYVATNPRDRGADVWEYDVWGYDFQPAFDPRD